MDSSRVQTPVLSRDPPQLRPRSWCSCAYTGKARRRMAASRMALDRQLLVGTPPSVAVARLQR